MNRVTEQWKHEPFYKVSSEQQEEKSRKAEKPKSRKAKISQSHTKNERQHCIVVEEDDESLKSKKHEWRHCRKETRAL